MKFSALLKIFNMDEVKENQDINPNDLPLSQVFIKKEVQQQKQPADRGKPMGVEEDKKLRGTDNIKEAERSSKEEGLNEANFEGDSSGFDDKE